MLRKLKENNTNFRLLFMSDHRTLTSTRGHDSGPVPYILYDNSIDRKTGLKFSEEEAKKGEFVPGATELMSLLFKE